MALPKTHQTFDFEVTGNWTLSIHQIWPDGDAPEDPTTEDVIERVAKYGNSARFSREWCMEPSVYVNGHEAIRGD